MREKQGMERLNVFLAELGDVRIEQVLLLSVWEWRVDESGIGGKLREGRVPCGLQRSGGR